MLRDRDCLDNPFALKRFDRSARSARVASIRSRFWIAITTLTIATVGCSDKRSDTTLPPDAAVAVEIPSAVPLPSASVAMSPVASGSAIPAETTVPNSKLTPEEEARFDVSVRGAIEREEIPGAVLIVVRHGQTVLRRAYGFRAKDPTESRMTADTIFDLASLTKPLATATSILLLAERGKLRLQDSVQTFLPSFKSDKLVTIEQLLRHTSGLPAGNGRADHAGTRTLALERILETPLEHEPGEAYVYSDLGYVLLGQIVEKASGEAFDVFAKKNIFEPLGMRDTMFRPPLDFAKRIAPTTRIGEEMLTGKVHDPLSRALGGIAGHAGLFSSADDVARFVLSLVNKGAIDGKAVLSGTIVRKLTELQPLPETKERRSLGLTSMFEGIGHTGFTGTAFWFDPVRDYAVVLLTNAVHPDGKGRAKQVRQDVASAAILMSSTKEKPSPKNTESGVRTGIDVLERDGFGILEGRKIGLITNHTGKDARGERTVDVLKRQDKLAVIALFTPEHGMTGTADDLVNNGKDASTGLPIVSLYGRDKRPPEATYANIDTLVFDIQDAGTRFYTYITTMGYMLEEAAKHKLLFVVLDRPNPLGGSIVEGPVLNADRESFVGYHEIPIRHGMTVGELAFLFNIERKIDANLKVIPMTGWTRTMTWSDVGLSWTPPSPNLRTPVEALLYPGVGLLETTNLSVGRGTDRPFEQIGAPFIDGEKLARMLNQAKLAGARFSAIRFKPNSSTFANEECGGVRIEVTNPSVLRPVRLGLTIASVLRTLYPTEWKISGMMTLLGNKETFDSLTRGVPVDQIMTQIDKDLIAFEQRRGPRLMYH